MHYDPYAIIFSQTDAEPEWDAEWIDLGGEG
jgi:hypothetical protein